MLGANIMASTTRTIWLVFMMIVLRATTFGESDTRIASQPTDAACVASIRKAILELHPRWDLRELSGSPVRDISFYPKGPEYHVVEVLTADQSDPSPLGPIMIWLGLFKDGKFVRLATHDELMICIKRIPPAK